MSEIERHQTMWAEMSPDIYAGKECDEVAARWYTTAEGDKGGGDFQNDPLSLRAKTFPPGTRVLILEPLCPGCSEQREPAFPLGPEDVSYEGKCRCGFDWDQWVQNEYA